MREHPPAEFKCPGDLPPRKRTQPYQTTWGPRDDTPWPPDTASMEWRAARNSDAYGAYRRMRAWLRENAGIFALKP